MAKNIGRFRHHRGGGLQQQHQQRSRALEAQFFFFAVVLTLGRISFSRRVIKNHSQQQGFRLVYLGRWFEWKGEESDEKNVWYFWSFVILKRKMHST